MSSRLNIYTLEYKIHDSEVINLNCFSKAALIEADIVIIDPDGIAKKVLSINHEYNSIWKGKPVLEELYSNDVLEMIRRRRNELNIMLDNGKTIFCFLKPMNSVNSIANITQQVKGRTRIDTKNVTPVSNYSLLPDYPEFSEGTGAEVRLNKTSFDSIILPMQQYMYYDAYFSKKPENSIVFAITPKTGNAVGIIMPVRKGNIIFLPSINIDRKNESSKLLSFFVSFTKAIIEKSGMTPLPEWCKKFAIPGEDVKRRAVEEAEKNMEVARSNLNKKFNELFEIQNWKQLLYEQGKSLETVVKEGFKLFGFTVTDFNDNVQQHDVILECAEGRILGEIEGKDDKAINIEKFRHLNTNLDEDFERTGNYAKGLLIGNGYRLIDPMTPRPCQFTEKVIKGAKSKSFALLTTDELFKAVVYSLGHRNDEKFIKTVREKIFNTSGEIVKFDIPGT